MRPHARHVPSHLSRSSAPGFGSSTAKGSSNNNVAMSQQSSRGPNQATHKNPGPSSTAISSHATAALIRRILCSPAASAGLTAPRAWQDQLPALTSATEVDEQVYAILAIVIRDFVLTWYGKITPDHEFVDEVITIIAHCTNALERRARLVDWVEVIGHELPKIVIGHIDHFKTARLAGLQSAFVTKCQAYHSINPHPAFDPAPSPKDPTASGVQSRNEAAYRQLVVQSILAVLLPEPDLQNPTLRILVADIVADMILGNVMGGRICEGWFVWEGIAKATSVLEERLSYGEDGKAELQDAQTDGDMSVDKRSALERSGLLDSSLGTEKDPVSSTQDLRLNLPRILWWMLMAMNHVYTSVMLLISVAKGLYAARLYPPRSLSPQDPGPKEQDRRRDEFGLPAHGGETAPRPNRPFDEISPPSNNESPSCHGSYLGMTHDHADGATPISGQVQALALTDASRHLTTHQSGGEPAQKKRPLLLYNCFAMVSRFIALDERMPWLSGLLDLFRHQLVCGALFGRTGDTDGPLDKYLYHQITANIPPSLLPTILVQLRAAVFPDNALGPARHIPDAEEQARLRVAAVDGILNLLPPPMIRIYYGDEVTARKTVDALMGCFEDAYCNKHLVFAIVDLLVVRLMPELAAESTGDLRAKALGQI